ncbi:hypothetical protein MMAN_10640 [Mycobacterium mantenii]|uniref:Uncharacterized protein n=1 Tax=Mycobacterium mantenii TaxID=560555 RepID=A0ABN6A5S7_MYCNT|nr:hypothetical protein [Mycobacterium mantenii]MCV7244487.1 hypothetical protein [Mycobacterium mantenii]BBY36930.1 hypothetical protein MMAN_10640 [Mycobacterium mantenii]
MGSQSAKARAGLCGCVAAVFLAVGFSSVGAPVTIAASSGVTPAPPAPTPAPPSPGGALPVQPAGGGGCVIGLNCGCTRNCHKPHPRPPDVVGDPQHAAPAPPNP